MNSKLRKYFNLEIEKAKNLIVKKDYEASFTHLERAHVLGQRYVIPHTISHWYMLKIGIAERNFKEVLGQLIRLPLGILGSLVGIVPTGNTGGSNVSAFQKMEITQDLLELMEDDNG